MKFDFEISRVDFLTTILLSNVTTILLKGDENLLLSTVRSTLPLENCFSFDSIIIVF